MAKDKLISPSFCYILAANFLLFFAFYLILPILPFYLQDQFDADKSMIGFILSCYTIACKSNLRQTGLSLANDSGDFNGWTPGYKYAYQKNAPVV